jgi:hypothetical protein
LAAERLDYEGPRLKRDAARFPGSITFVFVASLLAAGAAGGQALLFADIVGGFAVVSIAGGVACCVAVLGCLANDRPRLGRGVCWLALVLFSASGAAVRAHVRYREVAERIPPGPGGVKVVYVETGPGRELATFRLARTLNGVTAACALLSIVLTLSMMRRRRAARGEENA